MRILVVGPTGEIGRRLVRRLLEAGHELTLHTRRADRLDLPPGASARVVEGAVTARDTVEAAAEGCEVVYHLAGWRRADFRVDAGEVEEMRRVVVTGARVVAESARAAGARRLVYTSSHLAVGEPRLSAEGDYALARRLAEAEVFRVGAAGLGTERLEVLVLCPALVVGLERGPFTRLVEDLAAGRVPVYPEGTTLPLVAAEDVVEAHHRALRGGVPGGKYLLMGGRMGWRQLADLVGLATGWPVVLRPVGARAARLAASFDAALLSRLRRRDPIAGPERLAALTHDPGEDGHRAARELSFEYHDLAAAIGAQLEAMVRARRIGGD
ncbi:MAG: NAD-dependent epimerase/dehydratase family protein [Deltaproteobacteria bacterium]|nr:MAG: NAD-dependent epimerase/dehydratase family protein [Deltaproteobacteria bacterium]